MDAIVEHTANFLPEHLVEGAVHMVEIVSLPGEEPHGRIVLIPASNGRANTDTIFIVSNLGHGKVAIVSDGLHPPHNR